MDGIGSQPATLPRAPDGANKPNTDCKDIAWSLKVETGKTEVSNHQNQIVRQCSWQANGKDEIEY